MKAKKKREKRNASHSFNRHAAAIKKKEEKKRIALFLLFMFYSRVEENALCRRYSVLLVFTTIITCSRAAPAMNAWKHLNKKLNDRQGGEYELIIILVDVKLLFDIVFTKIVKQ